MISKKRYTDRKLWIIIGSLLSSVIIVSIVFLLSIPTIMFFMDRLLSPIALQKGRSTINISPGKEWVKIAQSDITWDNEIAKSILFAKYPPEEISSINNLLVDQQNRVWMTTDGMGLFMLDDNTWYHWWIGGESVFANENYDALRGVIVSGNQVYAIATSDGDGVIINYDLDKGIWKKDWRYDSHKRVPTNAYQIAAILPRSYFFGGNDNTIRIVEDDKVTSISMPERYLFPTGLYPVSINELFYIGMKRNLYEYSDGRWYKYLPNYDRIDNEEIHSIEIDKKGRIILALDNDLIIITEERTWHAIAFTEIGIVNEGINDIAIDNGGSLWFLTNDNLYNYRNAIIRKYTKEEMGLGEYDLPYWKDNIMDFDNSGRLWIALENGVLLHTKLSNSEEDAVDNLLAIAHDVTVMREQVK